MDFLVSVIIPVYKVEKFIEECILSVINQTYKNLEIILIDDGSPDNSPKICDKYAKKDKRISVIHKENTGVSDSRNIGLDKAKGEFVMFCDSDDFLEPMAIEILLKAVIENDADMSMGTMILNYANEKKYKTLEKEIEIIDTRNEHEFFLGFSNPSLAFSSPWAKIYKTKNIKDLRFKKDFKYGEDQLFNFDHYRKIRKIVLVNQCVYNYRIHEESFVRQNYTNACDLREKLMPYQIEFCSDINNKRLINYFCGEYLKDFIGGLYIRKLKNSKTDCKNYYHKKINQEEFKFCLKNSKFCNSKIKIVKLVLKTKIFSFAYLLSKIYYNKKLKNRMKKF